MTHGLLQLIGLCSTQRPSGKLQGLRIASSPRHMVRLDWPQLTYCQSKTGGWMTNRCWLCSSLGRRVICGTKTASTSDTPHTLEINCSLLCNMANGPPRLFSNPASHDFYVIHLFVHLTLLFIFFCLSFGFTHGNLTLVTRPAQGNPIHHRELEAVLKVAERRQSQPTTAL